MIKAWSSLPSDADIEAGALQGKLWKNLRKEKEKRREKNSFVGEATSGCRDLELGDRFT